jgi:Cobalamin-independent synthase, N-terminal domain
VQQRVGMDVLIARVWGDEMMEAIAYYAYEASSDLAAGRGMYASYAVWADSQALGDFDPEALDTNFAMACGTGDVLPLEMTKWFDANYLLVPELSSRQGLTLRPDHWLRPLNEGGARRRDAPGGARPSKPPAALQGRRAPARPAPARLRGAKRPLRHAGHAFSTTSRTAARACCRLSAAAWLVAIERAYVRALPGLLGRSAHRRGFRLRCPRLTQR